MEMPRSGFAGAVTCSPSACSRFITSFQLEASAKAPCTRTTVGCDPSCGLMLIASPFPTRFSSGGSTFPLHAWCHHPQSGANFGECITCELPRIPSRRSSRSLSSTHSAAGIRTKSGSNDRSGPTPRCRRPPYALTLSVASLYLGGAQWKRISRLALSLHDVSRDNAANGSF
jgi:hypothetical protein